VSIKIIKKENKKSMKKKIFLILQFLLLSVILSADNAQTYNNFEKFNYFDYNLIIKFMQVFFLSYIDFILNI